MEKPEYYHKPLEKIENNDFDLDLKNKIIFINYSVNY